MDLEKPARRGRDGVRFRLLSLGVVVAVVAAGCGGSSTPTTTAKKTSAKTPTTTVSKPLSVTMTTPSASTKSSASSGTPTFASLSNCTALSGVGEQFAKAMTSATSGGKFNLNAAVKVYQNIASSAPSAIRPDIEALASAFSSYAAALNKVGYKFGSAPSASQITALEAASKDLSGSKMETASKALEAWAVKNCSA